MQLCEPEPTHGQTRCLKQIYKCACQGILPIASPTIRNKNLEEKMEADDTLETKSRTHHVIVRYECSV